MDPISKCMDYDDVAWEKSEDNFKAWCGQYFDDEKTLYAIGHLITKHRLGTPTVLEKVRAGAFNLVYRMRFLDGGSAIARFPKPGQVKFPEEKHTTIPVPFILHYDSSDESPEGLGPFTIMEWIEHETDLYDLLKLPNMPDTERPIIDPEIPPERIEYIYSQLADILLQLSKLRLPKIGALRQAGDNEDTWEVTQRPLSHKMNALVELGGYQNKELLATPFGSTPAYYRALSEQMMRHFITQPHYCFRSTTEGQYRFMARWLFRKLVDEGRLPIDDTIDNGSFPLLFDDLRPSNVLIGPNDRVVGIIDWEFVYAAPAGFSTSPTWWLMMDEPEFWPKDRDPWSTLYQHQLDIFLKCMEAKEDELIRSERLQEEERLSDTMRRSWKTGDFWINYMVRRPWAFDAIYWREVDHRFFDVEEGADQVEVLEARKTMAGDELAQKMKECIMDEVQHHNRMFEDRTTCCRD